MRVTWVNAVFREYRVPVYADLARRMGSQFTLLYSAERLDESTRRRVTEELGASGVGLTGERSFRVPTTIRRGQDRANSFLQVSYQPRLYDALSVANPEVVIAEGFFQWTPAAIWWRQKAGAALVLAYERTAHTERHAGPIRTAYRRLLGRRLVDAACCNGSLSRDYCSRQLGIPESRIVVGAMAAEPEYLRRHAVEFGALTAAPITESPRPRFLYLGRLVFGKGVDTLLAAWREYQQRLAPSEAGSLLIAGEGDERERLLAYARTHRLAGVRFLGEVPYRAVGGLYERVDVLVLPTREDNWSLVVPEAMAFGKPIITTTANGCWPELVIPNRTGWLVEPGDIAGLARLLERCTRQVDQLVRMGAEAKEVVSHYTPESAASAFVAAVGVASSHRKRSS